MAKQRLINWNVQQHTNQKNETATPVQTLERLATSQKCQE